MNHDRELIERAARAVGYVPCGAAFKNGGIRVRTGEHSATYFDFNPLDDDGQALRLAVRRRLDISFVDATVQVCWFDQAMNTTRYVVEPINDAQDEREATRRAIVHAVAAPVPEAT